MPDCDAVGSRLLVGRGEVDDERHAATCPRCGALRDQLRANHADPALAPPDAQGATAPDPLGAASPDPVGATAPADAAALARARAPAPAAPQVVEVDVRHTYELGARLGEGGMGLVRPARDRGLGRQVALKFPKARTPELERRFEAEARITARLQHPSIVNVHEAGRWPTGEPYYAMKLVTGRPLDEVIAETRTLADRLALLPRALAVADALAYAHAQRVIHRDLKPQNVMVGEYGETVVLDWGLAKDLAAAEDVLGDAPAARSDGAAGTVAGAILGTPHYMPPEQAEGKPVDARADVYAIGAMLYHLLAGEPPYTGRNARAVALQVVQGPPRRLAERVKDAPADLAAILDKAMARDPAARYPTAKELADDLRRFQTGQLVGVHRYSLRELVARWVRRHRAAVAVGAAAAALLVGTVAVSFQQILAALAVAEDEKDRANEEADRADEQHDKAERAYVELLTDNGRIELLAAHRDRSAAFLVEAYRRSSGGAPTAALRFLLAQALRAPAPAAVLRGHTGSVSIAVFSPDGKRIASGSLDGTVKIWDAASGALTASWTAPAAAGGVGHLAWSPTGKSVAASGAAVVQLWDAESGRVTARLLTKTSSVTSIEFNADGSRIVTAGSEGPVQVWDRDSGVPTLELGAGALGAWSAAFSSDGRWVAAGGSDGTARVWEAKSGKPGPVLRGHAAGALVYVVFSPDGTVVATTASDAEPCLWNAETGALLGRLVGHARPAWSLAFSPDGTRIATGAADGAVKLWAVKSRGLVTTLGGASGAHAGAIQSVAFSPDGRRVLTAGLDRFARVWDAATGALLMSFHADTRARWSPDGKRVVTSGGSETVRVWDVASSAVASFEGHGGAVHWAAFGARGERIATASGDGFLQVWDVAAKKALVSVDAGLSATRSTVSFDADGKRLLAPASDGTAVIWDASSGKRVGSLDVRGDSTAIAVFSPDASRVLTTAGRTATAWDAATGRALLRLNHGDPVWAAAYSPDGARIVTSELGSAARTHVWDAATGKELGARLVGHSLPVWSGAFSPDGKTLVTASVDGTAKLWRWERGELLASFDENGGPVFGAAFSPDGSRVATGGVDGIVRIWEATAPARLLASLMGHTGAVNHVEFDASGNYLVSAGVDGTTKVWDVRIEERPADAIPVADLRWRVVDGRLVPVAPAAPAAGAEKKP
jgi:WD40 repeat protein